MQYSNFLELVLIFSHLLISLKAQTCFNIEFYTLNGEDGPDGIPCDTGNSDPQMRIAVNGEIQSCSFTFEGDDDPDCTVVVCDSSIMNVSLANLDATNGWIFQTYVDGKKQFFLSYIMKTLLGVLTPSVESCADQFAPASPDRCLCAANLSVLDGDLTNLGGPAQTEVLFELPLPKDDEFPVALVASLAVLGIVLLAVSVLVVVRYRKSASPTALKNEASPNPLFGQKPIFNNADVSNFRNFIQSTAFSKGIGNLEFAASLNIGSFKERLSVDDEKRLTFMKAQSARYSTVIGNDVILSMRSQQSPINRLSVVLYDKAREVINQVCQRVEAKEGDRYSHDPFRSKEAPSITLRDYLYHLVKSLDRWFFDEPGMVQGVGIRSLLISLIYLKKIRERVGEFRLTIFNQHRIFAVTMLVAAKFTEDCIIANSFWAKIAGVDVDDLNNLETEFCSSCGFELFVHDHQVEELYDEYNLEKVTNQSRNFLSQRFVL